MKKFLLIAIALLLALFCACSAEEIPDNLPQGTDENEPSADESKPLPDEKIKFIIGGTEYELAVPEKTRITDSGDGYIEVSTSSLAESGAVIDLSGLSGCEYIQSVLVKLNGENENLILPELPNLSFCEIYGNNPAFVDASGTEGCVRISLYVVPKEIKIGKGPENLELGYDFDISKISDAENVKSITVHGNADLSKIAGIGEVEKVFVFGENDNVAGLENLGSLKKLSLQAFVGDLSAIGNLSMETLALGNDITQETLDTLSESETVTELQLNDEFITNADFMEKLPNLKTLVLSVLSTSSFEGITEEQLEALETNIPKEPLKDFLKNGGTIYLVYDWSR